MRINYDADQMTDSLCETFEDYARFEEGQGRTFNADVWRKAADIAKAHVGRWIPNNSNKPIDTWKEIDVSDI